VAKVFPVRHFVLSMEAGFLGTAFNWTDVLVVAAWGIAGMLLAIQVLHLGAAPGLIQAGALVPV